MVQVKKRFRKDHWFFFTIPALVIYVWFMAFPLFNSMRLSFYTGTGLVPSQFVGLQNYVELFTNPLFKDRLIGALKNTCILFAICMGIQNTLGLMFANILAGRLKGRSFFRTIIFLPATMSVLVTGFLWKLILNPHWGAVNQILVKFGFTQFEAYPWLGKPETAMIMVGLVTAWQWVGIPTMIFLAGFQGISEDILEAASIDGASATQMFWRIKLPLLTPVIGLVSVMTFVGNFNAFDIVFAMTNARGAPEYSTDIMGTLFYRIGIAGQHPVAQPNMGVGASIATVIFFILFLGVSLWLYSRERGSRQQ
ncbi:MAG TPA: ABC transporter permease [Firmicutes bacterium]|jgi:raffinose/stachyose/melibiose transport system permease protein|nr:ABC transporter permease [Bacillota bacterium]